MLQQGNNNLTQPQPPVNDPLSFDNFLKEHKKTIQKDYGIQSKGNEFGASRPDHTHEGIDIPGSEGETIESGADGEVVFRGWQRGYGNVVYLKHPDGTTSRYGHLKSFQVELGDLIKKGVPLGQVGSTGNAKGPHVHYERRDSNNLPIDPYNTDNFPTISGRTYDPLSADAFQQEAQQNQSQESDPLSFESFIKETQSNPQQSGDRSKPPYYLAAPGQPYDKTTESSIKHLETTENASPVNPETLIGDIASGKKGVMIPFKKGDSPEDVYYKAYSTILGNYSGLSTVDKEKFANQLTQRALTRSGGKLFQAGTDTPIDTSTLPDDITQTSFQLDHPDDKAFFSNPDNFASFGAGKNMLSPSEVEAQSRYLKETQSLRDVPRAIIEGAQDYSSGAEARAANILDRVNQGAEALGLRDEKDNNLLLEAANYMHRRSTIMGNIGEETQKLDDKVDILIRKASSTSLTLAELRTLGKLTGGHALVTQALISLPKEATMGEALESVGQAILLEKGMHYTAPMGRARNLATWTAIPFVEERLKNPNGKVEDAFSHSIEFGLLSALGGRAKVNGKPVTLETLPDYWEAANYGKPPSTFAKSIMDVGDKLYSKPPSIGETIEHRDPTIDGKEVISKDAQGRAIVANEERKGGVSKVKVGASEEAQERLATLLGVENTPQAIQEALDKLKTNVKKSGTPSTSPTVPEVNKVEANRNTQPSVLTSPSTLDVEPSGKGKLEEIGEGVSQTPPLVAEGYTRFYRADHVDATEPLGQGWVANQPEYVSQKHGKGQMGSETIWYRDVPNDQLDADFGDHRAVGTTNSEALDRNGGSEPKLFRRVQAEVKPKEKDLTPKLIELQDGSIRISIPQANGGFKMENFSASEKGKAEERFRELGGKLETKEENANVTAPITLLEEQSPSVEKATNSFKKAKEGLAPPAVEVKPLEATPVNELPTELQDRGIHTLSPLENEIHEMEYDVVDNMPPYTLPYLKDIAKGRELARDSVEYRDLLKETIDTWYSADVQDKYGSGQWAEHVGKDAYAPETFLKESKAQEAKLDIQLGLEPTTLPQTSQEISSTTAPNERPFTRSEIEDLTSVIKRLSSDRAITEGLQTASSKIANAFFRKLAEAAKRYAPDVYNKAVEAKETWAINNDPNKATQLAQEVILRLAKAKDGKPPASTDTRSIGDSLSQEPGYSSHDDINRRMNAFAKEEVARRKADPSYEVRMPTTEDLYGTKNKLVTTDSYEKAKENIKKAIDPTKLNSIEGFLSTIPDVVKLGAYHIEAGAREFTEWAKRLANDLTPEQFDLLGPHLVDIFTASKQHLDAIYGPAALKKVNALLREASKVRESTEALYTEERSKRIKSFENSLLGLAPGEETALNALHKMGGGLPKDPFRPIREQMSSHEADALYSMLSNSDKLGRWEKVKGISALRDLLNPDVTIAPSRSSLAILQKVYGNEFVKNVLSMRSTGQIAWEEFLSATNIPRTILASFDLSAPFRQGMILSTAHPFKASRAFQSMVKAFAHEWYADQVMRSIEDSPMQELREKAKLYLSHWGAIGDEAAAKEEFYALTGKAEELVHKYIPFVARSERAYLVYLNKLRADVFDQEVAANPSMTQTELEGVAQFINYATGRGDLGVFTKAAPVLNNLFFSPRFSVSRFEATYLGARGITETSYNIIRGRQTEQHRKMAARDFIRFVGAGNTLLLLAHATGASVGYNPLSSDFGKIQVGNTRVDIWGGMQQPARYAAQLTLGERLTLSGEIKQVPREEILMRFARSKESPQFSFIHDLWLSKKKKVDGEDLGTDFIGKPVTTGQAIRERLFPMAWRDIYEAVQEDRRLGGSGTTGGVLGSLGLFGVGITTIPPRDVSYDPYGDLATWATRQ